MFKHADIFDYSVRGSRSENCILIDSENWIANTSNAVIGANSRGGIANTYITEVLATNIPDDSKYAGLVQAGDIVLLTSVATRMYCARTFSIPIDFDCTKYTDIPMAHVIGKFERGVVSLSSLTLFGSQVILSPVDDYNKDELAVTTQVNRNVHKVIKVGPNVTELKEGDIVLTRDNIVTDIMIYSKQYGVTTENMIVGVFQDNSFSVNSLKPINSYILLEDYMDQYAEGSSIILNPAYDVSTDIDQMSEVYNEDRFKIVCSSVASVNVGDVLDVPREATNYATLKGVKYFVLDGLQFVNARVKRG